jgi:hypothetical protein
MKNITRATVKSFIKKNKENLFINVTSSFDGMVDGCMPQKGGFVKAKEDTHNIENTLGINGAWFVGSSRDYFTAYDKNGFEGIEVYNSCGCFTLAVKK